MMRSSCGVRCGTRGVDAPTVAGERGEQRLVGSYRRLVEPVVRGPLGVAVTVAAFAAAGALGGQGGLIVASGWVLAMGSYCQANFLYCRETHCVITGGGWTPLALLGLIAALAPGYMSPTAGVCSHPDRSASAGTHP